MKAKRRITKAVPVEEKNGLTRAFDFLTTCKKYKDSGDNSGWGTYLMGQYTTVFKTAVPSGMLCLIEAKIAYHLQKLEAEKAGTKLSSNFMKNYNASQKMDLDGFGADSKFYMEQSIKKEQQEVSMGVMKRLASEGKKTVKTGNVKAGEKITPRANSAKNVLVELFKKGGMSDEKILSELTKRTGKKFDLGKVKRHRARFESKGKK